MSFIAKLMQDAQPKADAISNAAKNVTTKVAQSRVVETSKALSYKALVNTVGIGIVLGAPVVNSAKSLVNKGLAKMEELAGSQKVSK